MVLQIEVEELAERIRTRPESFFLLDVREPSERDTAVILPSVHIPMNDVPERKNELPRDRPIIVYCHSGGRSMMVAGYLEGEGFKQVTNLEGGIDRWSRRVDPSVSRY